MSLLLHRDGKWRQDIELRIPWPQEVTRTCLHSHLLQIGLGGGTGLGKHQGMLGGNYVLKWILSQILQQQ